MSTAFAVIHSITAAIAVAVIVLGFLEERAWVAQREATPADRPEPAAPVGDLPRSLVASS